MRVFTFVALMGALLTVGSSCRSIYYGAMSKVGIEKRDIFEKRVVSAKKLQELASDTFGSTMDRFTKLVNVDGGNLEKEYKLLKKEYDRCESRAEAVNDQIASLEKVAGDLFKEWKKELSSYSNKSLRKQSEAKMKATKKEYDVMVKAMRSAASKMDPVLSAFGDQVLFLKHNLNSKAIASISGEVAGIESQVSVLISEMQKSISHADAVIAGLE